MIACFDLNRYNKKASMDVVVGPYHHVQENLGIYNPMQRAFTYTSLPSP